MKNFITYMLIGVISCTGYMSCMEQLHKDLDINKKAEIDLRIRKLKQMEEERVEKWNNEMKKYK